MIKNKLLRIEAGTRRNMKIPHSAAFNPKHEPSKYIHVTSD